MSGNNADKDIWDKTGIVSTIFIPIVIAGIGFLFTHCQNESASLRLALERKVADEKLESVRNNQKEKLKVDRLTTLMSHFSSERCNEKLLAIEVSDHLVKKEQFPSEIFPVIKQIVISDDEKCKFVKKVAEKFIEDAARRTSEDSEQNIDATLTLGKIDKKAVRGLPPRVYINIKKGESLMKAEKIKKLLEAQDIVVPRINEVTEVPSKTDLRYFTGSNPEDISKINTILKEAQVLSGDPTDLSKQYPDAGVSPRHYEIWFGYENPDSKKTDSNEVELK